MDNRTELERRRMEAVGRLTGDVAHEFNNVLHVVNMNLELVSRFAAEDKVKPVVERARTAARRGARLTSQLLSFARRQPLGPGPVDINKLLLGIEDLLQVSAGGNIAVELVPCEGRTAALIDSAQFEMALLDLATKSREAMPDGGTLTIATSTQTRPHDDGGLKAGAYVVVTATRTGGSAGAAVQMLFPAADPDAPAQPVVTPALCRT